MASFNDITKRIKEALEKFNSKIPASQRAMLEGIEEELQKLDLSNGRIKTTVGNLQIINSVKRRILKIVLNDDYTAEVKQFVQSFRDITTLQNEYWVTLEKNFKPRSILKQIQKQTIADTVAKLTEAGIGSNIGDAIADILNTNITAGGSLKSLTDQLRESLTDTTDAPGLLSRYGKQITTDSIYQYNANYTQIVSADLGFEWYAYQGSDIRTTRPFCDAMTDFRYFHISEIPRLLRAEDLYYEDPKTQTRKLVPIYAKTGLPQGMIAGTDPSNFFIRRGGYNCGHQIRPVSERLVPKEIKDRVYATSAYQSWKRANGK